MKKVEQGSSPASAGFVAAAAEALGLRPDELYRLSPADVLRDNGQATLIVPELREALDALDDPRPEGDPPPLDVLADRLAGATRGVRALRYAEAGARIPGLLHHLYVRTDAPGSAGELARSLLHDGYRVAATVANRFHQPELAAIAHERHRVLAPDTGDPLRIAISAFHRSTLHLRHGSYGTGTRILEDAQRYTDGTPAGRAVAIQLHLRAAVTAARAADPGTADAHLDEARAISREHAVPSMPYYNINADPLNIAVHWCAIPVEGYDGAEATRRAALVRVDDPSQPERVAHHHIDQARAWLLQGNRGRTLDALNEARRIAPLNTREHPQVHETVRTLAESDRRATDSLTGFARWAGIAL